MISHRALLSLALLFAARASAFEVHPDRPQTLRVGLSRGSAIAQAGDARRSRLPGPAAHVLWQARISGGLSGNLLADETGRLFVTGNGQVQQFSHDGQRELDVSADFASALASALGADGTRAVLTREGRLLGFGVGGEIAFETSPLLQPGETTRGHLLPSNGGGYVAMLGPWAFHIGSRGEPLSRIRLPAPVEHLASAGRQFTLVDERGAVYEWDGYGKPALRTRLDGRASACAAAHSGALLFVLGERRLMELPRGAQRPRTLWAEPAGLLPILAVPDGAPLLALRRDGARISLATDGTPRVFPAPAAAAPVEAVELLADAEGRVAWVGARAPLALAEGAETQQLQDVQCSEPLGLASLGPERLAVACRSGEIWAIGP